MSTTRIVFVLLQSGPHTIGIMRVNDRNDRHFMNSPKICIVIVLRIVA